MATTAGGLPYVEPSDLVSGWPAVSKSLAETLDTKLAAKAPTESPVFTGAASFQDGTETNPAITNTGDLNTGIYFPAADFISFTTGGTNRANIDNLGRFGVGTGSPLQRLDARDTAISGGAPASTGSASDPNAVARFGAGAVVCDQGVLATGTWWLQVRLASNYATLYDLALNPNGGMVRAPAWYNTTTTNGASAYIGSDGAIYRSTSSRRYKTDIEDLDEANADKALSLRPVWFRSTNPTDVAAHPDWSYYGLIAEEVAEVDPRLVFWGEDEDGNPQVEGVQYDRLVPHLLSIVQRQQAQIDALAARLDAAGL